MTKRNDIQMNRVISGVFKFGSFEIKQNNPLPTKNICLSHDHKDAKNTTSYLKVIISYSNQFR